MWQWAKFDLKMDLSAIIVRAEFILLENIIIFSLIEQVLFGSKMRIPFNSALFKLILLQTIKFSCHDHSA